MDCKVSTFEEMHVFLTVSWELFPAKSVTQPALKTVSIGSQIYLNKNSTLLFSHMKCRRKIGDRKNIGLVPRCIIISGINDCTCGDPESKGYLMPGYP